jgi:hypothetical protein
MPVDFSDALDVKLVRSGTSENEQRPVVAYLDERDVGACDP